MVPSLVGDVEFDVEAAALADRMGTMDIDDRIAAACRGSANPGAARVRTGR